MLGTLTAVLKYARSGAINWYLVGACLLPCVIASSFGSHCVMYLSDNLITWMIILCIPFALVIAFVPKRKQQNSATCTTAEESTNRLKAIALISPIGFYDGLIGPGTGTYMALTANKGLGMGFLRATGFAKPLNLATNVGSAIVFILSGKVLWLLVVLMAFANILGAYLGSHSAIKNGDGFIKKIMLIMLCVMLVVNVVKLIG